jgi:hypothetical protein
MVRSLPRSRPSPTNRAQVMLMDRLEAEFPALSWLVIYKAVARARIEAARSLPDMLAYCLALDQHTRHALTLATDLQPVGSQGQLS